MFLLGHQFDADPIHPWALRQESLGIGITLRDQDQAMTGLKYKLELSIEELLETYYRKRQEEGEER